MDTSTLDLYQILQSGPYDEAGLNQVKRLLATQRHLLRTKGDLHELERLITDLEAWAVAAGGGWLGASALAEAADIAEVDLRNITRAELLRNQAIATGRPSSLRAESVATEGAIDANAELLHELKTMPPGALTQTLLAEEAPEEATEELDVEAMRESSIPRPRAVPAPSLRTEVEARRPSTLHGYVAPQTEERSPFAAPAADRESQVDARTDRRSTPVPTLLSETTSQSDFPARLRSTPPAALRAVTEPRRSAGAPSQPRAAGGAAAASQALRPAMQTQPIRLTPLPQLSVSEDAASATEEHTQEVHTVDLELRPTLSVPPLAAASPANDDALSAQIAEAEQVLETDTSPDRVRELAELYVKRDAEGDRAQAADLYCTLGEVLGNPGGVAMLDRALALVPDHADAKALLSRYAMRPRVPISSPKITVLGMPPKLSAPQVPPPAAGAGIAAPPPAAGAAPPAASRPDVLSLHGVPQVVTTRPSVPPISSLTPIVRSDASELNARRLSVAKKSYVTLGGIALGAAAAMGLYLSMRGPSDDRAPLRRPDVASETAVTASQPLAPAAAAEAVAAAAPSEAEQAKAGKPGPLPPPGPSHLPLLKLESAQLRGGKLNETQLTAALGKAQPKLLACYEQAIERKPRIRGRVIYGFTVRPNGRATNVKRVGGTLKDDALLQCSVKVLETVRFPKPRKASQVKLPIQYKRT